MAIVTIRGFRCERCIHIWTGRGGRHPVVCPKCKSPYWNIKRRIKNKGR